MPLADRTPEANMAYLCQGVAEDLMNAFFPVEGLRVLSATDTFALKNTHKSTSEIGAALGATVVLEGSVQRAGRHWIAFRLTLFQRLFSDEVKQHPRYRNLLTELHLDTESRERMRAHVATLTPITGVEVAPLLAL